MLDFGTFWGLKFGGFWFRGLHELVGFKVCRFTGLPIGSIVVPFGDYFIGF